MRSKSVTVSAVGVSNWIPVNWKQRPVNIGVAVDFSSGSSGITYEVQHTFDDLGKKVPITSISRSGTTVTVVFASDHLVSANDSIVVEGSGINGADGVFPVASVVNSTTLTYTSSISGTATGNADTRVTLLRVFPHEFLTGKTVSDDGNYAFPVTAVRLSVSALTAGAATLTVIQSGA
jgi:hypothetical protein